MGTGLDENSVGGLAHQQALARGSTGEDFRGKILGARDGRAGGFPGALPVVNLDNVIGALAGGGGGCVPKIMAEEERSAGREGNGLWCDTVPCRFAAGDTAGAVAARDKDRGAEFLGLIVEVKLDGAGENRHSYPLVPRNVFGEGDGETIDLHGRRRNDDAE